jgi:hypothetical protein
LYLELEVPSSFHHRQILPKNRAVRFDGRKDWFNVTKDEAKAFKKD